MVEALLAAGADVALPDKEGWTPLAFAAQDYLVDIAEVLLKAGAPVDAMDSDGNTPLFRAVFWSRGRGEMIKLLLGAGADKNRKNKHGVSPAELANNVSEHDVRKWLE
jgi:ankyrin repeat protein